MDFSRITSVFQAPPSWRALATLVVSVVVVLALISVPIFEKKLGAKLEQRVAILHTHQQSVQQLLWRSAQLTIDSAVADSVPQQLLQLTTDGHWRATLEILSREPPFSTLFIGRYTPISAEQRRFMTLQQNDITLALTELRSVGYINLSSNQKTSHLAALNDKIDIYWQTVSPHISGQVSALIDIRNRINVFSLLALCLAVLPISAISVLALRTVTQNQGLKRSIEQQHQLFSCALVAGASGVTLTDSQTGVLSAHFPLLNIDMKQADEVARLDTLFMHHLNDCDLNQWKTHIQSLISSNANVDAGALPIKITLINRQSQWTYQIYCRQVTLLINKQPTVLSVFMPYHQDKHASRQLELFKRKTQKRLQLIERLTTSDQELAHEFFDDANRILKQCKLHLAKLNQNRIRPKEHRNALLHAFHQLKGDSAILQFNDLARRFHNLEECVIALGQNKEPTFETLVKLFNSTTQEFTTHRALLRQYSAVTEHRTSHNPTGSLEKNLRVYVNKAARDMGKGIFLKCEGLHLITHYHSQNVLLTLITQLLRNAIAHGIESPQERREQGKPEQGSIELRLQQDAKWFRLSVKDNGQGVDLETLVKKSNDKMMLKHLNQQQITGQILFNLMSKPGLSTENAASEHAGRGIGLSVIKQHVTDLGGRINVRTQRGGFTEFVVLLPNRAPLKAPLKNDLQ